MLRSRSRVPSRFISHHDERRRSSSSSSSQGGVMNFLLDGFTLLGRKSRGGRDGEVEFNSGRED